MTTFPHLKVACGHTAKSLWLVLHFGQIVEPNRPVRSQIVSYAGNDHINFVDGWYTCAT